MLGTFLHEEGDRGSFTRSAASNYCQFLRENVSKGEMYTFQHFEKMGCKKSAIYRVMRAVDAEETVAQEEGHSTHRDQLIQISCIG